MREDILDLVMQENPGNPLQYVRNIVKDFAKEKLDEQILSCKDCSICECSKKTIGHGNTNASVMIIGGNADSPMSDGAFQSALYDNESSTILDKVLFDILEVNKEELYFANSVNCWPYKQTGPDRIHRVPTKQELTNCSVFIKHAIEIVQPLAIIVLGSVALNLFEPNKAITKCHGEWFDIKGIPAVATFHPDYFLKVEGKKDEELVEQQKFEFIDDMKKVFSYVRSTYSHINI